MCLQK